MAQEQVELLGCPFCGGKAEYFSNAITDKMVNCRSCGAAAFGKKWNTRATPDVRNGLDGVTAKEPTDQQQRLWAGDIMAAQMALYMVEQPMRGTIEKAFTACMEWIQANNNILTAIRALDVAGEGQTYADFQQRRGRLPDLIEEALEIYRGFMADDDYNAQGCLDKVAEKLRSARDWYDRPGKAPSPPPAGEEWREIASEAQFLIDRIEEMDWSLDPEEFATQWFGHVNPPVARLKALLAKMPGAGS